MNFGQAIQAAKQGKRVARAGWNGRGMFVIYVPGTKRAVIKPSTPYYEALLGLIPRRDGDVLEAEILPHFDIWTVNAEGCRAMLPGWLASQSDMDAEDWRVVDNIALRKDWA